MFNIICVYVISAILCLIYAVCCAPLLVNLMVFRLHCRTIPIFCVLCVGAMASSTPQRPAGVDRLKAALAALSPDQKDAMWQPYDKYYSSVALYFWLPGHNCGIKLIILNRLKRLHSMKTFRDGQDVVRYLENYTTWCVYLFKL